MSVREGVPSRLRTLVFCLILIPVLLLQCRRTNETDLPSRLPRFQTQNIYGEAINSNVFRGRYTFITFIDPRKKRDVDLCRAVREQEAQHLNLVIVSRTRHIPPELLADSTIHIIHDRDLRLSKIFNVHYPGLYYFYDPVGKLVGAGNNQAGYQEGPKAMFAWHLHARRFRRTMFIPIEGKSIFDYPWLAQMGRRMTAIPRPFYLFGLFSSVCDGCPSGRTFLMLSRIRREADERLEVRGVLSPGFKEIDIARITTQLRLNFPVELADHDLSEKWEGLNLEYRPSDINEFVFLADSGGKILLVFDPREEEAQEVFFHRCFSSLRNAKK